MTEIAHPVVVTRPLAQAQPLAERLRALGRNAVVFPLLEIIPLEDTAPLRACLARLEDYALVAFVSPNAIDAAMPLVPVWPREVALAVVGEGSRNALERRGLSEATARIYSSQDPLRSDSETLVRALDLDALRGKRVLVVRGETGRDFLANALRAAGAEVEQVAAYRRVAPQLDGSGRARLLQLLDEEAEWVVTSSEALRILKELAQAAGGDGAVAKMQRQRLVVPHRRIVQTAHALGCTDVLLTASGDEPLLAALQSRP
jgi:uroporphyrinogen-III synthase